jgi:hypothetical protein
MPSAVREVLEGYVTGRVRAERLVAAVAAAYYGSAPGEEGEARRRLRPVVEVIERASPGVVALSGSSARPGFEVRLAERPFPPDCEPALRRAAEAYLGREAPTQASPGQGATAGPPLGPPPSTSLPPARRGFIARLAGLIQRLFSVGA